MTIEAQIINQMKSLTELMREYFKLKEADTINLVPWQTPMRYTDSIVEIGKQKDCKDTKAKAILSVLLKNGRLVYYKKEVGITLIVMNGYIDSAWESKLNEKITPTTPPPPVDFDDEPDWLKEDGKDPFSK